MKNILKNNKGFTLLEILVTVGIVGVLSAVAVPAYNQYKRGTIETAVESDVGNFQKAYMAYNAVNGDYCATFQQAGIRVRDNRNYRKQGAIGFSGLATGACTGIATNNIQVIPNSGSCTGTGSATAQQLTACQGHNDQTACSGGTNCQWNAGTNGTITDCTLDIDQFRMGATTNVSGIEKIWGINEEGKIGEAEGSVLAGKADCTNVDVVRAWQ